MDDDRTGPVQLGRGHEIVLLTRLYVAQELPHGLFPPALPVLLRSLDAQ